MRLSRTIKACFAAFLLTGVVGVASASAAAPEIGRCLKVAAKTGKFANSGCTKEKVNGSYEWLPYGVKVKFKTQGGVGALETANGTAVGCNTEESGGEFNSPKTVTGIVVRFTGCHSVGLVCSTAGAKEGEIVTNPLEGRLGIIKSEEVPKKNKIGLDLFPTVEDGGLYDTFNCGVSLHLTVGGSVLVPITQTNKMIGPGFAIKALTLKYAATKGKQKPENFEGEPHDVLLTEINGKTPEQSGITVTVTQTGEEAAELNTVF